MPIPDDSALLHFDPNYDPAKAREYYLRNRHLKGRQKGVQTTSTARTAGARLINPKKPPAKVQPPKKTSKQLQEEAHARQVQLQGRLDYLHKILASLMKQAKARSGATAKADPASPAQKQKDAKGKSPQTAKEKRQAHQDYLKNKDPKAKTSAHDLQLKVHEVEDKIKKVRAEIKASIADARKNAQAHPKTAPKGR